MTHHPHLRTQPPVAVRAVLRLGRVLAGLLATGLLAVLVAGMPYGLWHWIGWPLPHHVPTTTQVKDTLTGPFTDQILLDTLACLCWILWAVFLTDIAHAVPDTLRGARQAQTAAVLSGADRQPGPLRGLAALLLSAILAGLLSLRPDPALASHSAAPRPGIVATALQMDPVSVPITAAPIPSSARTAVVQAPHDGIHDSLWRIAQRHLGDGTRWPEIYQLNKGHPQPDGGTLTHPSIIQPGWIMLLPEPAIATTPTPPHAAAPPPSTSPLDPAPGPQSPPLPTPTSSAMTSTPIGQTPAAPSRPTDQSGHSGIDLGDGLYMSLGFAAAISGALVAVRWRNRRCYTPGSGRRDDLPVAPVVRSLHLAHLRATTPPLEDDDDPREEIGDAEELPGAWDRTSVAPTTAPPSLRSRRAATTPAARDVSGAPLDLANSRGVGLVGAGAGDAARAILLDLLSIGTADATVHEAEPRPRTDVLIPAADLELLIGSDRASLRVPSRVHVVADLATALDQLESAILYRTRQRERGHDDVDMASGSIVLLARVPADTGRLQAVLDNGAPLGITAVLLGQWRPGTSVYVGADGLVSTAYGPAAPPRGTRLFSVAQAAAETLLGLLHDADQLGLVSPETPPPDSQNLATGRPTATVSGGDVTCGDAVGIDAIPSLTEQTITDLSAAPPRTRPVQPDEPASAPASAERRAALVGPGVAGTPNQAWFKVDGSPTALKDRGVRATRSTSRRVPPAPAGDGAVQGGDETPPVSGAPLALRVLSPLSLSWASGGQTAAGSAVAVEIIGAFSPRVRELLVALALHPEGITRDRLADTLWPDSPRGRPFNNLNTNLARLRTALSGATAGEVTEIVLTTRDQHRLDPTLIDHDYRIFADAAQARQLATTDTERIAAWRQMVSSYRGELAEGQGAEWLETPREAIRRDAVDAATGLARLVLGSDPQQALDLLEGARSRDPYNEQLYGDIMRVQRRLGQADAIGRTLSLLAARLAELQETPSPQTIALAEGLQQAVGRRSEPNRSSDTAVG